MYISYILNQLPRDLNTEFTLRNCFFGSVKQTNNAGLDKCKYSNCGIGFDFHSEFLWPEGSMGKFVIIFGADMSSYVHIDNNEKDILTLGEGPTQGLDNTILTAEAKYYIKFTNQEKD